MNSICTFQSTFKRNAILNDFYKIAVISIFLQTYQFVLILIFQSTYKIYLVLLKI